MSPDKRNVRQSPLASQSSERTTYEARHDGIYIVVHSEKHKPDCTKLSNFTAVIIYLADTDDGQVVYRIRAVVARKTVEVVVAANEFAGMGWLWKLGPEAIAEPGRHRLDQLRAAIQWLSGDVMRIPYFKTLGWHQHAGQWIYVHTGGIIRPENPESSTAPSVADSVATAENQANIPETPQIPTSCDVVPLIDIPAALQHYRLPEIDSQTLQSDAQAALNFLNIAPLRISLPVFAAIWHAILFEPDFAIHVSGPSGNLKTEIVAIAVQYFGPQMNARKLASAWSSTANYIKDTLAIARHVVFPVDDFLRTGTASDIARMERMAEEIFRDVGNHQGRGRSNPWGRPKASSPPAGMLMSTGESSPGTLSLRARYLDVKVEAGEISGHLDQAEEGWSYALGTYQSKASGGVYARAAAAYIQHLATELDDERQATLDQAEKLRSIYSAPHYHPRAAVMAASLHASFESFLIYAQKIGVIDDSVLEQYFRKAEDTFFELLEHQAEQQAEVDPTKVFFSTLASRLLSGSDRLEYLSEKDWDDKSDSPVLWGYERREVESVDHQGAEITSTTPPSATEKIIPADDATRTNSVGVPDAAPPERKPYYVPRTSRIIGWKDYDLIHLDTELALQAVQIHLRQSGQPPIPWSTIQLGKQLVAKKLINRTQADRNVSSVYIKGVKHAVWTTSIYQFYSFLQHDGSEDAPTLAALEIWAGHKAAVQRLRKHREQYEQVKEIARQYFSEAVWLELFGEPLRSHGAKRRDAS